ncbi:MAG: TIGR03915 family putative DNA repair protein [Firmicutes bacterium]|nr:TIGR03915 family putative DNA repair protein [Bacillota bacterium]
MEYLYDNTFDGLLTCLYEHVYTEHADSIISVRPDIQISLGRQMQVETDLEKSEKVAHAIETKISPAALRRAYNAWLTAEDGKEMDVLRYVFLGFKLGKDIDRLHGSETVRRIDVLNHKVSWEADRILGILRFSVIQSPQGEVLYAAIHPNCDLIQTVMPHFLNRFRQDPFIIHDVGREKAAFAAEGSWVIRSLPKDFSPQYTPDEQQYRELWRGYFKTAAIDQRRNPSLQKHFIPTRYWQYLTEMQ